MDDNNDRPRFSRQQAASIEQVLNDLDRTFWEFLYPFLGPVEESRSSRRPKPPKPKEPAKLLLVFSDYAAKLFVAEATFYPESPQLPMWLEKLKERIHYRISDTVEHLENEGESEGTSLLYHGASTRELVGAVEEELDRLIQEWLAPPPPRSLPLPPQVRAQMDSPVIEAQVDPLKPDPKSFGEELDRLLNEARKSAEWIAEKIGVDPTTVYRHKSGKLSPTRTRVGAYERVLSGVLGHEVKLPTPVKRQKVKNAPVKRQ